MKYSNGPIDSYNVVSYIQYQLNTSGIWGVLSNILIIMYMDILAKFFLFHENTSYRFLTHFKNKFRISNIIFLIPYFLLKKLFQ